ncbi:MAG: LysR family transcriptional regulator [Alphaproteobacteria bacterium]
MAQMNAITLKQLRALAAVNVRGSVTAAADMLNLTVPAVSTQLKQLEANMGATLLVRASDGKGSITRQGQQVLATIAQIESALDSCAKSIDSINSGKSGLVTLGVVSTGKYFAPSLVALAKKQLPDIRVDLIIGNRRRIISALEDQSIDLAIMGRPPRYPAVESVALGDHPHILIATPDHPLIMARDISPERLLAETFIMREAGSGTRILMERFLDRVGEGRTYDQIEFNTNETIKQAVIAGLGIALISAHTVMDALAAGRIATINMPGLPIIRQWHLVRAANAGLPPVTEKVLGFIIEQDGRFLPHLP